MVDVPFFPVDGTFYGFQEETGFGKMADGKDSGGRWEEFEVFFHVLFYKLWGGGREITKAFQHLGVKTLYI